MTGLSETQVQAANWLVQHWQQVVGAGPLTKQLRERFGLDFRGAIGAIAEANRRRGK